MVNSNIGINMRLERFGQYQRDVEFVINKALVPKISNRCKIKIVQSYELKSSYGDEEAGTFYNNTEEMINRYRTSMKI